MRRAHPVQRQAEMRTPAGSTRLSVCATPSAATLVSDGLRPADHTAEAVERAGLELQHLKAARIDRPGQRQARGGRVHESVGAVVRGLADDDADSVAQAQSLRAVDDKAAEPEVVAVDGKTARRSGDKRKGRAALHMVSAWASRQRLVLGQEAVVKHIALNLLKQAKDKHKHSLKVTRKMAAWSTDFLETVV